MIRGPPGKPLETDPMTDGESNPPSKASSVAKSK